MVKLVTKRSGGAFLLELCMAMVILSIAFMLMTRSTVNACMNSVDGKGRLAATFSAKKKMKELRIAPYTSNGSDKDTVNKVPCVRTWSIADTSSFRRISVLVTYQVRGVDKTICLTGASR